MPNEMSITSILQCCEDSVISAENLYQQWSGGWPAITSPESLVQIELASKIHKKAKQSSGYVTLEDTESSILRYSNAHHRAKPNRSKTARVDIVVWGGGAEPLPRILIETKKLKTATSAVKDAERILHLMQRCSCIEAGIIVGYAARAKPDTLGQHFKNVHKALRNTGEIKRIRVDIPTNKKCNGRARLLGLVCILITRRDLNPRQSSKNLIHS